MIRTLLTRSAAALAIGLALAAGGAVAQTPASAPAAVSGATVVIHLRGMKPGKGAAIILLFDSEKGYDASNPAQSAKVDATAANADYTFSGITPGRYAIKAFYDMDGNGRYDQGTDGIAFSNHVSLDDPSHVPSFSETSFMVRDGANTQQMTFTVLRS
jgi:uncharacterized protein (DUF2141 family)